MNEEQLVERVERLERDNRRMKVLLVATLVLAAGLGAGAFYEARRASRTIKAGVFEAVDSSGKVQATLGTSGLRLFSPQGKVRAVLGASGMTVFSAQGKVLISLEASPGFPAQEDLAFYGRRGSVSIGIDHPGGTPDISFWSSNLQASLEMTFDPSGTPQIELEDPRGFTMDLGGAATVQGRTGVTRHYPAASIVMFGNSKDHHVIWQAP